VEQNDQNLIRLFVDESREHLAGIEDDLLAIEGTTGGTAQELTDKVFRAIHTIKGSSGFFNLDKIKNLSHGMENILGALRARDIEPHPETITVLLDCADTLKMMIGDLDGSNDVRIDHLLDRLSAICRPDSPSPRIPPLQFSPDGTFLQCTSPVFGIAVPVQAPALRDAQAARPSRFPYIVEFDGTRDTLAQLRTANELYADIEAVATILGHKIIITDTDPPGWRMAVVCTTSLLGSILADILQLPPERVHSIQAECCRETAEVKNGPADDNRNGSGTDKPVPPPPPGSELPHASLPERSTVTSAHGVKPGTQSLRVNIETLDRLMTLAGEMVLTRNELLQNVSSQNMHQIQSASQKVDAITSELQEAIMSTRMLSVGVVLSRFRRFARDIARQSGKQLALDIRGEEVELDKSIVEAIGDPLTHIVRNAIDHGIEMPDVRTRLGKPSQGTLLIAASHEAGHVLIEIIDDGRGIDPAAIRAKARSTGIIEETVLASMSDEELVKLIFRPGFSTAEKITDLSGRGVGMDVVQSNLKRIGGAIDIHSVPGVGTTLRIKLPLTLAIIPALLVSVEDERYAIPQTVIEELVRIPAADVKMRLESVGGSPVLRLRGELLPLIELSDIFGIQKTYIEKNSGIVRSDRRISVNDRRTIKTGETGSPAVEQRRRSDRRTSHTSALNIVVAAAGDFRYGIIADHLLDSAEIVVKPLGSHFCDCKEYAGATILGDGHVAMILDVIGIRRQFEMKRASGTVVQPKTTEAAAPADSDLQSFLIIENGDSEFFAIPIGLISRIDRISTTSISTAGGKKVINYHNTALRLLSIEDVIDARNRTESAFTYMIIMRAAGHEVGILAADIIDTVDIPDTDVDCITHVQPGIIGSAFIKNALTLIIDVFGMVRAGAPELLIHEETAHKKQALGHILILEDSAFFRKQVCSFIEDAGFETTCLENGAQGLSYLRTTDHTVDIILTDIEMPEMNGIEFTKAVRAGEKRFRDIPIVAITSVSGEAAEKRGRDAGVDAYLIKFERQAVLNTCMDFIERNKTKETV